MLRAPALTFEQKRQIQSRLSELRYLKNAQFEKMDKQVAHEFGVTPWQVERVRVSMGYHRSAEHRKKQGFVRELVAKHPEMSMLELNTLIAKEFGSGMGFGPLRKIYIDMKRNNGTISPTAMTKLGKVLSIRGAAKFANTGDDTVREAMSRGRLKPDAIVDGKPGFYERTVTEWRQSVMVNKHRCPANNLTSGNKIVTLTKEVKDLTEEVRELKKVVQESVKLKSGNGADTTTGAESLLEIKPPINS